MKKQHRIVSLLLVFTLLFSTFVFTGSVTSSAAGEGDSASSFTPSATYSSTVTAADYNSTDTGNEITWSINDKTVYQQTAVTAGNNKYLQLTNATTHMYNSQNKEIHYQWQLYAKNTVIAPETGSYYAVFELDIATENDLASFSFVPNMRLGSTAGDDAGHSIGWNVFTSDMLDIAPGEFHHLTFVMDYQSNTMYMFLDNKFVASKGNMLKNPSTTTNFVAGMKIQMHPTYTSLLNNTAVGDTILADNISAKVYKDDAASNIAEALAFQDLSRWSSNRFNESYTLPTVPVLAKIDGTEYRDLNSVNGILGHGYTDKEAEILRDCISGDIVVNTNVTLDPHIFDNYKPGDNAEILKKHGDGKLLIGIKDNSKVVSNVEKKLELTPANATAAAKHPATDNILGNFAYNTNVANSWGTAGYRYPEVITDNVSGNSYYHEYVQSGTMTNSNAYIQIYNSQKPTYNAANNIYMVYDLDVAVDSLAAVPFYHILRGLSGGTVFGNKIGLNVLANNKVNEFAHATIVVDMLNDKEYVFVNGALVQKYEHGAMGNADIANITDRIANGQTNINAFKNGTAISSNELRIGSNSTTGFYLDNFYVRIHSVPTAYDSLATALAANDITAWAGNIYDSRYEMPVLKDKEIAVIDGETYTSASGASAVLAEGGSKVNVSLEADFAAGTINRPAFIKTHGHSFTYTLGAGLEATESGDLISITSKATSITGPAVSSNVVMTKTTSVLDYVKNTSLSGNIFSGLDFGSRYTDTGRASYLVQDSTNSNIAFGYDTRPDPNNGVDSYVNWNFAGLSNANKKIVKNSNQFLLLDFDTAIDDYSIAFYIQLIPRTSAGALTSGTNQFGISDALKSAGIPEGDFAHITVAVDSDNGYAYVFVNGMLMTEKEKAGYNPDTVKPDQADHYYDQFRIGQGAGIPSTFYYDNIGVRLVNDATLKTAISNKTLTGAASNIYNDGYDMAKMPAIATVNGNPYYTVSELNEALEADGQKNVEILHSVTGSIIVSSDAKVNTNGFGADIMSGRNTSLIKEENGVHYFSASYTSNISAVKDTSTGNSTLDSSSLGKDLYVRDSLVTSLSQANKNAFDYYVVNDGTDDHYGIAQTIVDKTGANTFISVYFTGQKPTATSYSIFEIDIATSSAIPADLSIKDIHRNNGPSSGAATPLKNYNIAAGKWMHLTIIGDYSTNTEYVFINGELKETVPNGVYSTSLSGKLEEAATTFGEFRINISQDITVDKTSNLYFDNISFRMYGSDTDGLAACVANKSLAPYEGNVVTRQGTKIPVIANVDGIDHYNAATLATVLSDGNPSVAYLYNEPIGGWGTVTVNEDAIIALHGAPESVIVPGFDYDVVTKRGVSVVSLSTELCDIVVNVNGEAVYSGSVERSTDIKALLEETGSYFGNASNIILAGNGKIFTGVKWTNEPTYAGGDMVYEATGTKVTKAFYVHNKGTEITTVDAGTLTYDDAGLRNALAHHTYATANGIKIILNSNRTINTINISVYGRDKALYLNGYTLDSAANTSQCTFFLSAAAKLSIYGPGVFNDMSAVGTQAIFFGRSGGEDFTGSVYLKNVEFNCSQALAIMRSGSITLDNCTVNSFAGWDSSLFVYGEGAAAPVNININDSYISYRNYKSVNHAVFREVCKSATPLAHKITVKGSTIISQDYITSHAAVTGCTCTSSASSMTVEDSVLIAKEFSATSAAFTPSTTLVNNVSVNKQLADSATFTSVKVGSGVVKAYSNDHLTPITYTKNYATVNFANGAAQYWVDGSTPTAVNSLTKVDKVEAGKSYDFISVLDSAPFALKGNATLGSNITFNIYIPYSASGIHAVTVNGKEIIPTLTRIDGVGYNCYKIVFSPINAASAFDIIFDLGDYSIVRTMSLADYATIAYNTANSEAANTLMSNMLAFVKGTVSYFGVNADTSAIDSYLDAHEATAYTIPTSATDSSNVNSYTKSVQLNLMSTLRMRLNLADGVDGNKIHITVDGVEKETIVARNYVEVELHAYELAKVLTITVDGANITSGNTYDLAKYLNTVASGSTANGTTYVQRQNHAFSSKYNMSSLIYSYAKAAEAYVATLN